MRRLFTSESVTEGHPDKLCDQVSDSVLDAILEQDPLARVACETCTTTGIVFLMGEVTTTAHVSFEDIARDTILHIGYDSSEKGFDGATCSVMTSIHKQSPDIALGVDNSLEGRKTQEKDIGAGDQGMMFGFACTETQEMMPAPIALSHRITKQMAKVRKDGTCPWMRPDGKAQVTVAYENDRPLYIDTIVVSTQHSPDVSLEEIRASVIDHVIKNVVPENLLTSETRYYINPTGRFVIGGPMGDSGLTGRKIIVDTYGGYAPHGGGCFSGKDPTKVDRSAAYAARHAAKNIVAAGIAKQCEISLAYAIGVARPVSFTVNTNGTGIVEDEIIAEKAAAIFDMRPAAIIERLSLRKTKYAPVAAYGHFGRTDLQLPWEKLDYMELLRKSFL